MTRARSDPYRALRRAAPRRTSAAYERYARARSRLGVRREPCARLRQQPGEPQSQHLLPAGCAQGVLQAGEATGPGIGPRRCPPVPLETMSTLEPERGAGTGTLVEPTPQVSHGDGDHERYAHYVQKDKIMESALSGSPVVALCGKVWVPGRDPKKYPVCPMCKEIFDGMGAGGDKDGKGGKGGDKK
ncbi:hypothetical protein GCM10010324_11650 [Streptomyces hiroshimensis]|uniref:DUF3039 domain-containing protein n=2 Tax=Streptomyces TaxID=1883 RepID=A0ABQ2Y6M4_9ACTN|nr:hypothetical protein GCM10010324_11650 [Streptomyces hiroshimensis]